MRSVVAAVVLAILLAGCSGQEPDASTDDSGAPGAATTSSTDSNSATNATSTGSNTATISAAPVVAGQMAPWNYAAPVTLPGAAHAEPNVAVATDGTIFVVAPGGLKPAPTAPAGAPHLWRSQDEGQTWDIIRAPSPVDLPGPLAGEGLTNSNDADVITSPDGWVYLTDWDTSWMTQAYVGVFTFEASNDNGETWSATPILIPSHAGVAVIDRQWVIAGDDGLVAVFYAYWGETAASDVLAYSQASPVTMELQAVISRDHGSTWSEPITVVEAQDDVTYQIGHPRIAPGGKIWLPYGSAEFIWDGQPPLLAGPIPAPSEVRVAWSSDFGATWADHFVAAVPNGFDNLWAVEGAQDPLTGAATIIWAHRADADNMQIETAQSRDLEAWGNRNILAASGNHFLPWITANGGVVTAGWYGGAATGDAASADAGAQWFAYSARWFEGEPSNMAVQLVDDEPVKVGPLCPRGGGCNGNRELLDYVSVADGPGDVVYYAYARHIDGDLTVHVARGT